MVYLKKYNLIFLRVPKNASSSLSTWFIRNLASSNDVYSEVDDDGIKENNYPYSIKRKYRNCRHDLHLTLQELVKEKLVNVNDQTKVISVIRNPIERQLSLFHYRCKNPTVNSFRKDFKNGYYAYDPYNKILQKDYNKLNGKYIGEYWLYENIDYHLSKLCSDLNIKKHKLDQFKRSGLKYTPEFVNKYYDKDTLERVSSFYRQDIILYNELKEKFNNED
jgi:hypothetical protein